MYYSKPHAFFKKLLSYLKILIILYNASRGREYEIEKVLFFKRIYFLIHLACRIEIEMLVENKRKHTSLTYYIFYLNILSWLIFD